MSEESSTGAPEPQPTASAPDSEPEGSRPPLWRRRTTIVIAVVAVLLAVAVVIIAVQPSQSQRYAVLGSPCAMVSPAALARYLPGASDTGPIFVLKASPSDLSHSGGCSWSAPGGNLVVAVTIYGSVTGQGGAQQGFDSYVHASNRGQNGFRVTGEHPVPRLGDQAIAIFETVTPGPYYDVNLIVRSGGDQIVLYLGNNSKPAAAAQLDKAVAIARSVLAYLASSPKALPPSQQPQYAGYADPCLILPEGTVARYLPGATMDSGQPSTTLQALDACSWSTPDSVRILRVQLNVYGFVAGSQGAEQAFTTDVRIHGVHTAAGQQPVTGLGDQATAIYDFNGTPHTILLLVQSSNAEIHVSYSIGQDLQGLPMPTRAAQLATTVAIARAILAALRRD